MGKILGSWSGMRKYLEQEMLASVLHGRVRYGCTTYVGMDGCRIFEVCIDGRQVKRFSWETVNTYFIENGFTKNKNPVGMSGWNFGLWWIKFRLISVPNTWTRNFAWHLSNTAIRISGAAYLLSIRWSECSRCLTGEWGKEHWRNSLYAWMSSLLGFGSFIC